jgi:putative DNA primase/helicase
MRGHWLIWRKHYWQEDENGFIYRLAIKGARERYRQAEDIEDIDKRRKVAQWAIYSEHRLRLEAVVALAKNLKPISDNGKDWDTNPWLFAVRNGVINLKTGELQEGKREDQLTLHSDVEYDPDAKCPRWLQFLKEIFSENCELIDYIWRLTGYSLCGSTKEQLYMICYGKGANGKGRFLGTLRHVLGDYAYDAPFSTFELTNRTSIPNDLAALERRRFVTSSETNEGTRLNEARIKALSGEDPCTARYLHHEFFTFMPVCKIWLAVNHKPRVQDDSYGFWRRVRLIPFERQFMGDADDKNLGKKLRNEAPGILNWLIEGCLEWQKRGLSTTPSVVNNATEAYQAESDPLGQFIEDCCIIEPNAVAKAGDLYKAYVNWAKEQGLSERERFTNNAFGRRMGDKFTKSHVEHGKLYHGLRVLTEYRSDSISSSNSSKIEKEYKTDRKSVSRLDDSNVDEELSDEDVKEFIRQLRQEPEGDVSQFIASYLANIKH